MNFNTDKMMKSKTVQLTKAFNDIDFGKFTFRPNISIKEQIRKLKKSIETRKWNGHLSFQGFKGTFKVEYWIYIEPHLRDLTQLQRIKFVDTQLDKQHLNILFKLLTWIQPFNYELKFKQNELDDLDIQEFALSIFTFTKIKSVIHHTQQKKLSVISNPGIFKGSLISKLKELKNVTLIINDDYKSIGLTTKLTQKFQESLAQTYYYELGLNGCFTQENHQAFKYLIYQCYHEDHLEQLQQLNINQCYLGTVNGFLQDCQKLSTEKGLLELSIEQQENLNQIQVVQALMGDRYDQLRLNLFNFSENSNIDEDGFKFLANNVLTNSSKIIQTRNSFIQELSVLSKLNDLAIAFQDRISKKQQILLEELDLSTTESYNRKDLIFNLFRFGVFNEYSNIQKLVAQSLEEARTEGMFEALKQYKGKQQLKLKSISLPYQRYRIKEELFNRYLDELSFTRVGGVLQIEELKFYDNCCSLSGRQYQFDELIKKFLTENKQQFTLKRLIFESSGIAHGLEHFEFYLQNQFLNLVELTIIQEQMNITDLDEILIPLKSIDKKLQLKKLVLNVYYCTVNVDVLLTSLIYTDKIQLEHLELKNVGYLKQEDGLVTLQLLQEEYKKQNFKISLKTLNLGYAQQVEGLSSLIQFTLYSSFSQIENLILDQLQLQDILENTDDHQIVRGLQYLQLSCINEEKQIYTKFNQIFLEQSSLEILEFKNCTINNNLSEGLLNNINNCTVQIKKLIFDTCIFEEDFISRFIYGINCNIQELSFNNCTDLKVLFQQMQREFSKENLTSTFKKIMITLDYDGAFDDSYIWFLKNVVFDLNSQIVEELILQRQNIDDNYIKQIADIFTDIKKFQQDNKLKRFFKLRKLYLDYNSLISKDGFIYLFDRILNCSPYVVDVHDESIQNDTTKQLIVNEHLKLKQKVLSSFQVTPYKLKELTLNLNLVDKHLDLSYLYNTVISSLILSPGNVLEKLNLSSVQLDTFMEQTKCQLEFLQDYYQRFKTHPHQSKLKEIKLDFQICDDENIASFLDLYILNKPVQVLKIVNCQSSLLSQLLRKGNKQNCSLSEIQLKDGNEELSVEDSYLFYKNILFSQNFKIQNVSISASYIFNKFDTDKFKKEIESFDQSFHLTNLDINYQQDEVENLKFLANEIFSWRYIKLTNLVLRSSYEPKLFQQIKDFSQVKYESLEFEFTLTLCKEYLDLFINSRPSLKTLKFSYIGANQTDLELPNNTNVQYPICKLEIIDQSYQNSQWLLENFVFSPVFQFNQHKYLSANGFEQLQQFNINFKHLQILHFNFGIEQGSFTTFSQSLYQLIGKMFIYNEESYVEEILLQKTNLQLDCCKALTSESVDFKTNKILSLKRFLIYYSLTISQEGFDLISKHIWFHPNIMIEDIRCEIINIQDEHMNNFIKASKQWLTQHKQFNIKLFDIGRNDLGLGLENWAEICDLFMFTDLNPNLEILYIHFMSLNDVIMDLISQKIINYLLTKPFSFVHPLRIINFEQNKNLTHLGWKKFFQYLIFNKHFSIEEVILHSTNINGQQKIDAVKSVMPKTKIRLHTIQSANNYIKDLLKPIMSDRPINYKNSFDSSDLRGQNCHLNGEIEFLSDIYGERQQLLHKIFTNEEVIISEKPEYIKYSPYNLNFINHFIKHIQQNQICLSQETFDLLSRFFNYPYDCRGDPFPLPLLFCKDGFNFFQQKDCIIQDIVIIPSELQESDQIDQNFILYIWENLRSDNSINQIFINYSLNDDLIDVMFARGYTERDIISLIRILPPQKIRIEDSLTLQAIKGIYTIFWDSYNFEYSNMTYDVDNFLNMGIGYSLREIAYYWKTTHRFTAFIKYVLYVFFGIFVMDSKIYKFNDEVSALNSYLSSQKFTFFLIAIMNLLFYIVTIGGPFILSKKYDAEETTDYICLNGITKNADYFYYAYAFLTLLVEAYIYRKVSDITPSFIQKIIEVDIQNDDLDDDKPPLPSAENKVHPENKYLSNAKNLINRTKTSTLAIAKRMQQGLNDAASSNLGLWIAYLQVIIVSQLAKFGFYNNVKFAFQCYYCEYQTLFILATIVISLYVFNQITELIQLMIMRLIQTNNTVKLLSTKFINDFFSVSLIGRNLAISQLLDRVAPFNVTVIPNNIFTRFLIPKQAGKSINNTVKNFLLQFSTQDLPYILLQIFFIVSQSIRTGTQGWNIYLTIATSGLSILVSFRLFMSIRPSTIQQTDFDELALKKQRQRGSKLIKFMDQEKVIIQNYNNLFSEERRPSNSILVDEHHSLL